jgi:hypothetical protein
MPAGLVVDDLRGLALARDISHRPGPDGANVHEGYQATHDAGV